MIEETDVLSVDLRGQTAFVTGASSGLGRRFSLTLAKAGAKVAVAARRSDLLDDLVSEIHAGGGTALGITLDVADSGAIAAAVDAAEASLGLVTILVNNAGISGGGQPAVSHELWAIDAMLAVNVRGPFLLSREVARRLIAANRPGRIVNLSSIGAFVHTGQIPAAFYSVTKAAIARMSEVLAVEWAAHNINVNAIAPGFFHSEMSAGVIRERGPSLAAAMPRRRIGEPCQLDSTLLYLVAPASEFVTGVCIKVDDAQFSR